MRYLLDTNTCIGILADRSPVLTARWKTKQASQVRLCSVVKAELWFGAAKSTKRAQVEQSLTVFFSRFRSMPFDDEAARRYGELRATLETKGTLIGPNDMLIAAIALASDLTLVTHNTVHERPLDRLHAQPLQAPGQLVRGVVHLQHATLRRSNRCLGRVQDGGGVEPRIAAICQARGRAAAGDDRGEVALGHQPQPVRPWRDQQRGVVRTDRVEVHAHGHHARQQLDGRRHVQHAGLGGPVAKARDVAPLLHRDDAVLVPAERPVVGRRLVEQERTHRARSAERRGDQAAHGAIGSEHRRQPGQMPQPHAGRAVRDCSQDGLEVAHGRFIEGANVVREAVDREPARGGDVFRPLQHGPVHLRLQGSNVMKCYMSGPGATASTSSVSSPWEVIITDWALDSYLNLKHTNVFSDQEYWTLLRPDVELLREGIPSPHTKFGNPKFWGPASYGGTVLPDGFKMKWHQIGSGKVQLRLPIMLGARKAFLCEAYVKSDPLTERRMLARFKAHMNQIALGHYVYRGSL